ncbi:trichohyalin-like, partial [Neolamprologus brichardi]|uniref:trichohyalin-like n=1 Tax=Neolamprologus brichardi TaxID=32507 RepID=UPI0016437E5D
MENKDSRMTTEWNSTMENRKQSDSKQTRTDMKTQKETIKRQRQLICQAMEEIEQLWRQTERQTNEIDFLKTKTEGQQEDIERLTSERNKQHRLLKQFNFQIKNITEKLKQSKNSVAKEKTNLLKMWTKIYQEKDTLDRRRQYFINERHKLDTIKASKTESPIREEPNEPLNKQVKRELDILENATEKNREIMVEVKKVKEKMEKTKANIQQALKRNKEDISKNSEQINHIKHIMYVKINMVKHRWASIIKQAEMKKIHMYKEGQSERNDGKATFDTVKRKLCRIQEEMEKLWDVLEDSEQQLEVTQSAKQQLMAESNHVNIKMNIDYQKQQDSDLSFKVTHTQPERDDLKRVEMKLKTGRENVEKDKPNTYMQNLISEEEENNEVLCNKGEETKQSMRDLTEVKAQTKWTNFREKQKRRELERLLEKIMKERDELEIMKTKIQRQRERVEQKLENTVTEIKGKIEKTGAEINNTWEKMQRTQREISKNQEEAKNYMEKLTSMKTWVNKWISTQSTIKHTFSVNASKLQESQKEIDTDSLEDQTSAIPKDKRGTESITDTTSLQNSVTLDDQHQNKKIKEQQKEHFESKYCFAEGKNGEQDFCLQMRTEIHEEAVHDKTELLIIVREREEVEKLIRNLKQQEGEIKEQIKYTVDNMKEKTQDIKRLILEINDLQRADTVITVGETENAQEVLTKLLEETEQRKILMVSTKVFKNEIMKYEVQEGDDAKKIKQESSLIRLNVNKQKLIQKSGEEMKKHVEHTDEDKKDRGADIQRLRAEIYKTQEIIRTLRGGLENLAEKNNMDKYQQNEGSEIEGLLKDIKQFQEFLESVKTKIKQSEVHMTEEMSNMKSMKTAVKKKRRELDQRLENTLKERDGLDIFKIKMQRQTELIRQNLEKMTKVKNTVEKIAAKTRRKIEEIEISMKETEIKLRQFKDLDCINLNLTKGTKPDMEHGITPKQITALEIFKTEIKKTMDNERDKLTKNKIDKETKGTESLKQVNEKLEEVKLLLDSLGQKNKKSVSENVKQIIKREETEMTEQIQTAIKNEKMVKQLTEIQDEQVNHLSEKTERHKQELDDRVHMTKRQIREMELLQSELKIKAKEFERFFRKSMRKKKEIEIMWYEIQQEKEALRTEIKKKRRELDQRLEMTMRKRDELEVLRVKLKRQMEELAEEKQRDHNLFIHLPNEHEKHFGRKDVNMLMEKIKNYSSKVSQYTIYIQDIRDKFNLHMGTIRTEMKILENVNAHLEKDRKGFREVEAENKNITNKMKRLKYQLNIIFGRVTIQDTAEMDETMNIWEKIQREKQKLDMRLENIKRERQEIEALVVELEMKKRENQRIIKRSIQKEQKIKRIWATFKEERTALVRETKQKKEVEQRREEIIKHQGEQEIKQKLQKEKKGMESEIEDMRMKEKRKQIQKQWELLKKYLGEYKKVIKNTKFIIGIIQNENKHMQDQKNFYMTTRKETLNIKRELNRQKEIIRCALKNIQQEPKHGEQVETKIKTEQEKHENGRKTIYEIEKKDALDEREKIKDGIKRVILQDTKQDLIKKEIKKCNQEKEKVNQMKTRRENRKELLLKERRNIKDEQKEMEMRGDQVMVTKRECTENEWKQQFELDKRDLDKLKEDLRHDREDLERESEVLNKEKMDLTVLMSGIKKQSEILEEKKQNIKEERDSMEIIKLELLNKMEHVNRLLHETKEEKAKIKICILQVQTEKERLEDILSKILLTHNEQKVKEDDLRRQTKEVEIMKKELQSERAKLESLMRNLKKKQEELERAKEIMSEEKEEVKEMKTDIAKERELLLKERRNMEEERSEMEMRGDQVMDEMKSLEILKVKLQQLKEDIKAKMEKLLQNV